MTGRSRNSPIPTSKKAPRRLSSAIGYRLAPLLILPCVATALTLVGLFQAPNRAWSLVALQSTSLLVLLAYGIPFARRHSRVLRELNADLGRAEQRVTSHAEKLGEISQKLSSGATEAASSLQETAASIEELSSMVKLNADHAREASALSVTSRKAAEEGERRMKGLHTAMKEISASSRRIEDIIDVIDDIAFQTNLLALNAAVEAARAGENGKGFAVVAEAVRSLAQRSASAAKEISTLIRSSTAQVGRGVDGTEQSESALREILVSVKKVSDLNDEIAGASREQAGGIEQISKAINQLDQATQLNAASAEQAAATAEELNSQSQALDGIVDRLGSIVLGKKPLNQPLESRAAELIPSGRVVSLQERRKKRQAQTTHSIPSSQKAPRAEKRKQNETKRKPSRDEKVIPFGDEELSGNLGASEKFGDLSGF